MWHLDRELEVAVGFLVDASGFWPDETYCEHLRWFSMLAFCRPVEDLYDKVVDEVLNSAPFTCAGLQLTLPLD